MKNWKAMLGSLALAGALATAPGLVAADEDREHHHFRWHPFSHMHKDFDRLADKLELRDEQKAQLKEMHKAHKEEFKALSEESRKLHRQIHEAIKSGADQATLDSLGAQWGKVHVARMQMAHKHYREFEGTLSAEQKAKLEQMKAERMEKRRERREERRERRDD